MHRATRSRKPPQEDQLRLFGGPARPSATPTPAPPPPSSLPHNGTRTSIAAARDAASKAPGVQQRIAAALARQAFAGATRDELAVLLAVPLATICARVAGMLAAGLIRETSLRRPTRTGSQAAVLQLESLYEGSK